MPYVILDHTADTGIEARAAGLGSLIEELATGMFALMAEVETCPQEKAIVVEVNAPTPEDLVVEVLSELLYESEVEDLVLCGFEATLQSQNRIRVAAGGVPTSDVELLGPPIKAVTYHDITVRRESTGWLGRVYFDV